MAKRRKKTTRSGLKKATPRPPQAGELKEQLQELSAEQLVDIVTAFFDGLDEKHRLEFMNLLPSVQTEDMESELPYDDDEFLDIIEDFCERVRNEEFVEYGAGYDPEEGEYHGFGDDSWIDEMDELFEETEIYFLARHYNTVEKASQLLFECLGIEGFCFTTSDPQGALSSDLIEARKLYFQSLCHLYSGEELAENIIAGIGEYQYIGKEHLNLGSLFAEYPQIIQLLEESLIKRPSTDRADFSFLDLPAELLKQIYEQFRSLAELDQFAQQHGKKHPWSYENLVRAYAEKNDWQKVAFWADQGLNCKQSQKKQRQAILADYKTRAAQHLGDPGMALAACWDAFNTEATAERYVALRQAAKAQGEWDEYYTRLIERLTHDISGSSVKMGDLYDNRLLVEALLVEGEYERAIERATQRNVFSFWDNRENAPKSIVDFFLHSVTRAADRETYVAQYPEIKKRLAKPAEFIKHLGEEPFAGDLSDSERDRQIEWIVQMVNLRIDRIVGGQMRALYDRAAHDAKLIEEVYRLQEQHDRAQQFVMELHKTRYPRHNSFRAELRKLGLDMPKTKTSKK